MSKENPLWGAPRIRAEFALLGHEVAKSTVAKYMVKTPDPKRQQTWRTFLRNHLDVSPAATSSPCRRWRFGCCTSSSCSATTVGASCMST